MTDDLRPLAPLASALCLLAGLALLPADLDAQDPGENVVFDTALYDGLEYRMIGPYRGGRSTAVTGVEEEPNTYFMGTTGGGVWKTTNAGENWTNISDGYFDAASIGAVDVADSDPSTIYVGTGTACIRGNTSTGRGVYRSLDGGKSWSFVGLPESGQVGDIIVHPEDPETVYLAALGHAFGKNEQRGVFRTTDGGENWEKVLFTNDSTGAVDLAMNPHNPREIYAGMWRAERKPWGITSGTSEGGGIWKSMDGGDTWEQLGGGLPDGLVGKTAVTVSPANPDRVWAIIEAKEPEGGVYRSDDAGETWERVNRERKLRQRPYYYIHINADPLDENTVYVLNVDFYRSVDGGRTFSEHDVPHGDVHDLWINPSDSDAMVVANDGGGQVSLDYAASWSTMYNQPTAEFYSVTVDNQVPYHVYGPQQDNSTIGLPSWHSGAVHPKANWYSVGGCETGPVALHPDHPGTIYSGCYGGVIDRWDRETGHERNMMVYPQLQLGSAARDLRERFQWVSPIVVSPHDPEVVYHASQRIHRTTDGGMSWEPISGDLTTNDPEQQGRSGPITHEGTGVEVYNTVFEVTVSPHEPGAIWAGTDDGRVHITRDDGATWTEITPGDMPEHGTVDAIDVSAHDPGTAYMAVHRYRLDDFAPFIFRTEDWGESWDRIADGDNGIPDDHPVRVVREDPEREGLLYAGTEFGLFVSFDDGDNWQSLQLDLPVTPVTDLKVHRGDLVVATQGRSFWILDDLAPLRQLDDEVARSTLHLFRPSDALLVNPSGGWGEFWPEGPAGGASIAYYLEQEPQSPVTLEILGPDGEVVRSFTSETDEEQAEAEAEEPGAEEAEAEEPAPGEAEEPESEEPEEEDEAGEEPAAPAEAGLNVFTWNLTGPEVDVPEDAVVWGSTGGVRVLPGTYEVRLTVDGRTRTQSFRVRPDPRLEDVTAEDLEAQHELATAIRDTLSNVYDAIRTIRSVREQIESVARRAEEAGHGQGLTRRANPIAEELTAVEEELLQTRAEAGQDPINYTPQLDNQIAYLYGFVAGPQGRPTASSYERFEELNGEWNELRDRLDAILEDDVGAFNTALRDEDVPAVIF